MPVRRLRPATSTAAEDMGSARAGLPNCPRAMASPEAAAKALDLVRRYPPLRDTTIPRGDGCVCCAAFSGACRGIEDEWWNEWEREEFEGHLPSG